MIQSRKLKNCEPKTGLILDAMLYKISRTISPHYVDSNRYD